MQVSRLGTPILKKNDGQIKTLFNIFIILQVADEHLSENIRYC